MLQHNLKISQVVQLDTSMAKDIQAIYHASFPSVERVDFQTLVNDIVSNKRLFFVAKLDDTSVGFAVIIPLINTSICLLEYLAVTEQHRSKGIGSMLLQYLSSTLRETENVSGLIFEVESDDHGAEEEKKIRKRRIAFYERNGANLVYCAPKYRIPNLAGVGTIDMKLMWLPWDTEISKLMGDLLRKCICEIYIQSFERSIDDSLLQLVLRDLTC